MLDVAESALSMSNDPRQFHSYRHPAGEILAFMEKLIAYEKVKVSSKKMKRYWDLRVSDQEHLV